MRDGSVLFWELKAPKGVLSPKQSDWLYWLNARQMQARVIRDVAEVPFALGFQQRRAK